MRHTLIGVIGGMGSAASVLFEQMVQQQATARCIKQPDMVHIAMSSCVPDRTEFLLGLTEENPARFASEAAQSLQTLGQSRYERLVICVPCNTFHASQIWNPYQKDVLKAAQMPVQLLNVMSVLNGKLMYMNQGRQRIGVLCTDGSRVSRVFDRVLSPEHTVIYPTAENQQRLMDVIYSTDYGLKHQVPAHPTALSQLQACIDELLAEGTTAILFGCSELSLVREQMNCHTNAVLDPMLLLADAALNGVNDYAAE